MSIGSILRGKASNEILSVAPTVLISEVAALLAERRVGAVLVRDAAGQMLGILSERDIVRSLASHAAGVLDMTAAQLMTAVVCTVTPDTKVRVAMEVMTNNRVRHLPVMEGGTLVGLVSIGDVVKERLDQQAREVDQLRDYVAGRS